MARQISIIAGEQVYLDEQRSKERCVARSYGDFYDSESLSRWQSDTFGRWEAVVVDESALGWNVRYDSGLRDFAVLAGRRKGNVDGSREAAIAFAQDWASKAPASRYVYEWVEA